MNIDRYKILISNLPVRQQSFATKRKTWEIVERNLPWFKELNDRLFGDNKEIIVSRQDIFETKELREVIVKTIYWGYSRGMRNNYHLDVFTKIPDIEKPLDILKHSNNLTLNDYESFRKEIHKVRGIKLSTYSKLLYVLNIKFDNNPCLILDQRLIDVFSSKTYSDFNQLSGIRYENAEKKYLDFLKLTDEISKRLDTKGENIEQFLFIFGNKLKTNMTAEKISNMWNGYCPESLLKGKTVRMRLNQSDFFESEETGLQICIIPGVQAVILNFRGKGKFRTSANYADEIENGELLSPQNTDRRHFNNPTTAFGESEEIENYIATIN